MSAKSNGVKSAPSNIHILGADALDKDGRILQPNANMKNLRDLMAKQNAVMDTPWSMMLDKGTISLFGLCCETVDVETPEDIQTLMQFITRLGVEFFMKDEAFIYNKCQKQLAMSLHEQALGKKILAQAQGGIVPSNETEPDKENKNKS